MDRFNALGRGTQLMLVGAVLLLITSFFRWQEVEFDLGPVGGGSAGVSAWDDIGGILMGILTIVLIAWIVAGIAGVDLPLPVSAAMVGAVLAALILILAVVKNLEDDFSTFWAWLGMLFALVIAVGAWLQVQASGGVATLRTEASGFGSRGGGVSAASEPAAPAPPPVAPEAAPPADPMPEAAEPDLDEPSSDRV